MPRFFVENGSFSDGVDGKPHVRLTGDDAHHISRSLRMAVRDRLVVCDMTGTEYDCVITRIGDSFVDAEAQSTKKSDVEPPYAVTLYQCVPKGDKFDSIVQKSVECGVYAIVPVFSERCVSRPEGAALERKLERWRRISLEAAKQCGRAIVPEIRRPLDFNDAVKAASSADVPIFCYEGDGTKPLSALLAGCDGRGASISLFIGSEGGFSIDEADAAVKAGMAMASLGRRILRTETAAAFTLACISYEYER